MTSTVQRVALPIVLLAMAQLAGAQAAPMSPPAGTGSPDTVVLEVNGEPIHAWQVNLALPQARAGAQQQGQQTDENQIIQAAMQQVVQSTLLAQEATRRGYEADSERVQQKLDQIVAQAGGLEQLKASLGGGGIGVDELRATLAESDVIEVMVDKDIRPDIAVSDEEVAAFYSSNPETFETPEQVQARHILIKSELDADPEAEADARARAEAARERALAGEDFAELARELSEGPSAANGGDLGFFTKQRMVEPFASAAFALQPGDISKVVKTRFGFHVIKVTDRKPASTRPLDEVSDGIRRMLADQMIMTEVQTLLGSLGETAEVVQPGAMGGGDVPAGDQAPPGGATD